MPPNKALLSPFTASPRQRIPLQASNRGPQLLDLILIRPGSNPVKPSHNNPADNEPGLRKLPGLQVEQGEGARGAERG